METGDVMYAIPQDLLDLLAIPDGGFTWNPRTGEAVRSGYAVSPYKRREQVHLFNKIDKREIEAFVKANADLLSPARSNNNYMGAWHCPDDGLIYLDVTVVFMAEREARTIALAADQLAYYDFAQGKSISVDKSPAA